MAFQRAVALLCLLHHDLQATVASLLLRQELARTRQALRRFSKEDARPREELRPLVPEAPATPAFPAVGKHAEHIVQAMLDYLQGNYERPLTLADVANALQMNASYLSDLFSHSMGVTFHHCLDELRLARAEELLRDPRRSVCDVACAAGYASADYFRQAFKRRFGLSPRDWQQASQTQP